MITLVTGNAPGSLPESDVTTRKTKINREQIPQYLVKIVKYVSMEIANEY